MEDLNFSRILWIAGAYTLVITGLYLFGYWGRFGLNVLEYIGVGDIVSHALMPILATIATTILGLAIGMVAAHGAPGGGADTIIGRFSRTHWRPLVILDLVAMGFLARFGREPVQWFLIVVLTMPLGDLLTHHDFFIAQMPNPLVRARLLNLSLGLAALFFAIGRVQAGEVLDGKGSLFVDVAGSGLELKSDASHPVSYVGHVADFFVVYDSANSQVVFLNAQKIKSLALIRNPKAAF